MTRRTLRGKHGSPWKEDIDEIPWRQGGGKGERMGHENTREWMVELGEGQSGRAMKEIS